MELDASTLLRYLFLYVSGLIDAISIHQTLPTFFQSPEIGIIVLKILGANVGLIVGSEIFFHRAISPFLNTMSNNVLDLQDIQQYQSFVYLIYQALWLVPICVLCYACCLVWYQEIADSIEKSNKKGKENSLSPIKSVQNNLYAFLTWLFAFLQAQLLTQLFPSVSNSIWSLIVNLVASSEEISSNSILSFQSTTTEVFLTSFTIRKLLLNGIYLLLSMLKFYSLTLGFIMMSILYAWYAFDPSFISSGKKATERFLIMEKYFIIFDFFILYIRKKWYLGFYEFYVFMKLVYS